MLKQALNHELVLKRVHRIIKFKQEAWLKLHIDMNKELKKNAKNDLRKIFHVDEQFSIWKNRGKCKKT